MEGGLEEVENFLPTPDSVVKIWVGIAYGKKIKLDFLSMRSKFNQIG